MFQHLQSRHDRRTNASRWTRTQWSILLIALTLATLCVHGYHPLAEDGGLYAAGIEYLLDPSLFPHYTAFVQEHLRFSLFAPSVALLVTATHLSMLWCLFLLSLASIWLTLYGALQIVRRLVPQTSRASDRIQLSGIALLAAWWTIPVAGTSLLLMDPYVTARSFSTPCTLLAIAYALDLSMLSQLSSQQRNAGQTTLRALLKLLACLVTAAILHPLMAAYAFAVVVTVVCWHVNLSLEQSLRRVGMCVAVAILLGAFLQRMSPPESPALHAAIVTRYYWFLSQWQWYELIGILGPVGVFAALLRYRAPYFTPAFAIVCRAAIALCVSCTVIAILFAREQLSVHGVARLQPMRALLPVYALMALCLGICLQQWMGNSHARWRIVGSALLIAALASIMCWVQRQTFPYSAQVELPWRGERTTSPWAQAFLWSRENTPRDALFALDAKYINMADEDAQNFRATSLRSALPDYSKDGGEAAITPPLADAWLQGSSAQRNLSSLDAATRAARLRRFHVTWMILRSSATTAQPCPYDNGVVKVCPFR